MKKSEKIRNLELDCLSELRIVYEIIGSDFSDSISESEGSVQKVIDYLGKLKTQYSKLNKILNNDEKFLSLNTQLNYFERQN